MSLLIGVSTIYPPSTRRSHSYQCRTISKFSYVSEQQDQDDNVGEDQDDNVRESNEGITHMKIVFGIPQADQTFPFMDSSK